MKKGDETRRWGPEEVALSNFGGKVLSGVRGDHLATNYGVDLAFLNPQGEPQVGVSNDIVRLAQQRMGISEASAVQRLCGLRVALHEFLIDSGVRGWSDPRIDKGLRALIVALEDSDLVMAGLPDEELPRLLEFRRS